MTLLGLATLPAHPHVTVIIPAYDAERFVGEALRSLQLSTYEDWTCVVVDDGSSDMTADIAVGIAASDPRVKVVRQPNGGSVAAINGACGAVRGDLVALLDSDDLFLPDKLVEAIGAFISQPAAGLFIHRLFVTDEDLRIIGSTPLARVLPQGDLTPRLRISAAGDAGLGVTSGMVLRREVFDAIFPADPRAGQFPDELVRRIAPMMAEVAACERPLGLRRTHGGNHSDGARRDLASHLRSALSCYREVRHAQRAAARLVGFPLPADDLDFSLTQAVLARLDGTTDPTDRRATVRSPGFAAMGPMRRGFWRFLLTLPRPLVTPVARQLYGSTNAKLLLNRRALCRLARAGVLERPLPRPLLNPGRLLRIASTTRRTAN